MRDGHTTWLTMWTKASRRRREADHETRHEDIEVAVRHGIDDALRDKVLMPEHDARPPQHV